MLALFSKESQHRFSQLDVILRKYFLQHSLNIFLKIALETHLSECGNIGLGKASLWLAFL